MSVGQEENLLLDFKTINRADLTHADDKRNLAKALSGFANSSGGLVVWGIEARRNPNGIDCATGKREIDPLSMFVSRLNELTGSAASPIIEEVMHKSISSPVGDSGFAVTLVPESNSGPHMAKLGEDRYYKRSGDSFYKMEHFDLEDMFGRRKKPRLILSAKIAGRRPRITIYLSIQNVGRGTAKAPYLAFNVPAPFTVSDFGIDGNRNEGLPRLHHSQEHLIHRYGANSGFAIHPGTVHEVAAINLGLNPREQDFPRGIMLIEYEITAEDTQVARSSISIDLDQIA